MAKIPTPSRPSEVDNIAFYAAPPFMPTTTAFEMLVYLMEQPWADVKRHRGQVIVSDLRHTVGGTVVAVYTEAANVLNAPGGDKLEHEVAQVIQLRPRRDKVPT